jgi:pyruvate dehydrogenase E1 component alpha subunit
VAGQAGATETTNERALPDEEVCRGILRKMLLIRRFEERAGEMYAKAKVGGFLHLCIGEEATIVGACDALEDTDYLISTYREHGQAIARGTEPKTVMAELFGKATGCSGGRGGSWGATGSSAATCRSRPDWRWRPTTAATPT